MLRFSGGETLRVGLPMAEVRDLLQEALFKRTLIEFDPPNGRALVVNPGQVQYLHRAEG